MRLIPLREKTGCPPRVHTVGNYRKYTLRGSPTRTDTPGENITCGAPVGADNPEATTNVSLSESNSAEYNGQVSWSTGA